MLSTTSHQWVKILTKRVFILYNNEGDEDGWSGTNHGHGAWARAGQGLGKGWTRAGQGLGLGWWLSSYINTTSKSILVPTFYLTHIVRKDGKRREKERK